MIVRSAFWLTVMFVLVPHQNGAIGEATGKACEDRALADVATPWFSVSECKTGLALVEAAQATAITGLLRVKADLAAAKRQDAE